MAIPEVRWESWIEAFRFTDLSVIEDAVCRLAETSRCRAEIRTVKNWLRKRLYFDIIGTAKYVRICQKAMCSVGLASFDAPYLKLVLASPPAWTQTCPSCGCQGVAIPQSTTLWHCMGCSFEFEVEEGVDMGDN